MRWLTYIVLPACLNIQAQVNFPFPDSAATWVQYWEMMVTQPPLPQFEVMGTSNICLNGADTVIAGTTFTKAEQCGAGYIGALREVSGLVEFVPADSSQAYVLYDFNSIVGDTVYDVFIDGGLAFDGSVPFPQLVDYHVTDTGQVEGRRWVRLQQLWGGPDQIWIEGFGSPYGLFSQQDPINVSGYWSGIWCMSHQDTVWYFSEWEIDHIPGGGCAPQYVGIMERGDLDLQAYPNPTSDRVWVRTQIAPPYSVVVTDQCGRILLAPVEFSAEGAWCDLTELATGMYFLTITNSRLSTTARVLKQ